MIVRPPSDPLVLLKSPPSDPVPEGAEERVLQRFLGSMSAAAHSPAGENAPEGVVGAAPRVLDVERVAAWGAPFVVVGAIAGACLHAVFAPSSPKSVPLDEVRTAETPSAVEPRGQAPVLETGKQPQETETPATPVASSRGHANVPFDLARERALLDRARVSMAQGDPERALLLLGQHARIYRRGTLIEEREAMAVNALVSLGRYTEAEKRGASFRTAFPASLVLPSVEAALAAMPSQ